VEDKPTEIKVEIKVAPHLKGEKKQVGNDNYL
jgi:hypothetical protein